MTKERLIEILRGECRCGCRSGGCDRPEGCRCGPSCPCSSLTPEVLVQAANEIERLHGELEDAHEIIRTDVATQEALKLRAALEEIVAYDGYGDAFEDFAHCHNIATAALSADEPKAEPET